MLLSLTVAVGQDQFVKVPITGPLTSLEVSEVDKRAISGESLWTIRNGDFVHPTFSPDGNTLAYARVIARKNTEGTEILLHSFKNHRTSVLLNSAAANKYATYQAFVTNMSWPRQTRLEAEIHDGDVDLTRVTFNPSTRRLIREEQVETFGDRSPQLRDLPASYQKARQQAVALFPELPRKVLDNALLNSSALVFPEKGIVLQKGYHGHDPHIWFLDFKNKTMTRLMTLSEQDSHSLRGGLSFGDSILFLVFDGQQGYLFQYREGEIRCLTKLPGSEYTALETRDVKYQSLEKIVFLVRTHAPYDKGDNPLFVFDGNRLTRVNDYKELYDADIDPQGKRIAFCYWNQGKRVIAIKTLVL